MTKKSVHINNSDNIGMESFNKSFNLAHNLFPPDPGFSVNGAVALEPVAVQSPPNTPNPVPNSNNQSDNG